MRRGLIIILLLGLMILPTTLALEPTHIISNSEKWQDVYSVLEYANLQGIDSDFLASVNHGKLLLTGISKQKQILVISSKDSPYVLNYPDMIIAEGFADAEEKIVKEANTELIDDLKDVNNFIIVQDSYGYNAVAVIPYALLTHSWVFLVNKYNVQKIDSILKKRQVDKILVYGYMDENLRKIFDKYNPETINEGDKFANNIEIVKKFKEIKDAKQVILTNGEFIEKEIMGGLEPVLFTGRQNVPDQIRDYLKSSDIEIGVLIGNELMSAATNIRRSTGISVMVKFARSARTVGQSVAAVENLDLFPLPTPQMIMRVESVKYNRLTKQLEVTYKSEANVPLYFKGTVTINTEDGQTRVGESEPIFIAPGAYRTATYSLDLNSVQGLKAKIYTLFGETKTSLDHVLQEEWNIDSIEILDRCEIEINKVQYNKQNKEFLINVKNIADVDCWVSADIEDLEKAYEKKTIGSENAIKISKKSSRKIIIKEDMSQEDLDRNQFVNVIAHYGERETSLIKVFRGKFELKITTLSTLTYLIILVVLILIILFFLYRKSKKEDEEEGF